MGILTSTMPTLIDKFSRQDSTQKIMKIVETMARQNDILQDAEYMECNDGSKHKTTMRSGIPEPTFRMYNQGVQPSKSTTIPVIDTTGMMTDYGLVDKELADLSGNADAFRASENLGKLQGFNNKSARYMFYGNTQTEPQAFLGLAPRYNSLAAESGRKSLTQAVPGPPTLRSGSLPGASSPHTCCTRKAVSPASSISSKAKKPSRTMLAESSRRTAITSSGTSACRYGIGEPTSVSQTSMSPN